MRAVAVDAAGDVVRHIGGRWPQFEMIMSAIWPLPRLLSRLQLQHPSRSVQFITVAVSFSLL
jgi:hypothetical protein